MHDIQVLTPIAGRSISVSATAGSVGGTIDMTGCSSIYVCNTSTSLYVSVRIGVGAQTAVLADDVSIAPYASVVLGANEGITGVAAIASGAGPAVVKFSPLID